MFGNLTNAFERLMSIQDAVESARGANYFGLDTTGFGVTPPIDLFKKEDNLVLVSELPGVAKDDLKIEIKENLFRISGERKLSYDKEISIHRKERKNYKFDRTMKLPFKVDPDKVNASLKDGVLTVELIRAEGDKPRQVLVN